MRSLILSVYSLLCSLQLLGQTIYVTDSITYRYAGEAPPERVQSYLRQFGCIDQITDKTMIARDGDFITIVTELEMEGRLKVINITRNSQTELKTVQASYFIERNQTIYGYARGSIYFEEIDYYNPINSVESPYVMVNWIVRDFDNDEIFERLELQLVNSKDIIQIFHCHLSE